MMACSRLATIFSSALLAQITQAGVILPDADRVYFSGVSAFEVDVDPVINVATGSIFPLAGGSVNLTAVGKVNAIHEESNPNNAGSLTAGSEVTGILHAQLVISSDPALIFSSDTRRTYIINSDVQGGKLSLWDDATQDLNINTLIGGPTTIPAAAQDGDLYLDATLGQGIATLRVTYTRPDASSDFTMISNDLQTLLLGESNITGGSILSDIPAATSPSMLASQNSLGQPVAFPQIDIGGGLIVNGNVDQMGAGVFEFLVQVPEPTSMTLLSLGLLGTTRLRRRD